MRLDFMQNARPAGLYARSGGWGSLIQFTFRDAQSGEGIVGGQGWRCRSAGEGQGGLDRVVAMQLAESIRMGDVSWRQDRGAC